MKIKKIHSLDAHINRNADIFFRKLLKNIFKRPKINIFWNSPFEASKSNEKKDQKNQKNTRSKPW